MTEKEIKRALRIRENGARGWEKSLTVPFKTRTACLQRLLVWQRMFYEHLAIAQIRWRYELGDAGAALDACLHLAEHAAKQWKVGHFLESEDLDASDPDEREMVQSKDANPFPFGTAVLISALRHGEFSPTLLQAAPIYKDWERHM